MKLEYGIFTKRIKLYLLITDWLAIFLHLQGDIYAFTTSFVRKTNFFVDFSNIIYCFALKKLLIDTTIRSILIESSVQISGHKKKIKWKTNDRLFWVMQKEKTHWSKNKSDQIVFSSLYCVNNRYIPIRKEFVAITFIFHYFLFSWFYS